MDQDEGPTARPDAALACFLLLAKFLGVPADAQQIAHDRGKGDEPYSLEDLSRTARKLGLVSRIRRCGADELASMPLPALAPLADGDAAILLKVEDGSDEPRILVQHGDRERPDIWTAAELRERFTGRILLMTARDRVAGEARPFDISWFIPALVKYRKPRRDVLIASYFVQVMALVSPIFFQVVIDKVLVHHSLTTLDVLAFGLAVVLIWETALSGLRNWLFAHSTNRVDAELSARMFRHLLNLPLSYFESRRVGDSVARVRELERIREFLTSNAVTVVIDLLFTVVFFAVMYLYSPFLTLIVLLSIPVYALISILITPPLRARLDEKFRRGAENQAFLVETVTGIGTLKAMAVEPQMREKWEKQFAGYTQTGFQVAKLANWGNHLIQVVSKLTTVAILYWGAKAVIAGDLTVGALVAFNMLSGRVAAPILRLSQLWQEFQQVRISVDRLGDV
ncbi:MAG TPA: ABC transporter transmembrane domain-containing protein, partial [Allosphingosinicella sp.]